MTTPEQEPEPVKYYGRFDPDGRIEGFYASDINVDIPDDAVEITYEQWQELLDNQPLSRFIDGNVVILPAPPPPEPIPNPLDAIMARIETLEARN